MAVKVYSCSIVGLEGELVTVEGDATSGLTAFSIVGLGDMAVQEAKERVRFSIRNSGFDFPKGKVVINLAPANLRKQGPKYDLPMAVSLLAIKNQIKDQTHFEESIFVGELSLEGNIRLVTGVLPIAIFAKERGFKRLYTPKDNVREASLIPGIEVVGVDNLKELVSHLNKEKIIEKTWDESEKLKFKMPNNGKIEEMENYINMKDIKGQEQAKRVLEIGAAGAHNILFSGPPGSGKTLLARAFEGILPDMTLEESLEVTKIYSVAGLLANDVPLIQDRPFRSVHHTASGVSIVGGGKVPKPGEISLAHRGVLFLDEIAEFPLKVLEVLRQPLEDKIITIGRVSGTLTFPAHFTLIAAMNPCPCGFSTDLEQNCICSLAQVQRYQKKLSGPFLDRIDLQLEVPRVKVSKLTKHSEGENSKEIKKRVEQARKIQRERFKKYKILTNAEMTPTLLKKYCSNFSESTLVLLKQAVSTLHLSARSYFRVLKVARTIADLDNIDNVDTKHIAEALQYRGGEKSLN